LTYDISGVYAHLYMFRERLGILASHQFRCRPSFILIHFSEFCDGPLPLVLLQSDCVSKMIYVQNPWLVCLMVNPLLISTSFCW